MILHCIGDSITWGAWDCEGGWVARTRKRLDAMYLNGELTSSVLTYNHGISSDTSQRTLERMPSLLDAYSKEDNEHAFVISLGTNDSVWFPATQQFWVSEDEFVANMNRIVQLAMPLTNEHANKIVLLGSPSLDETKTHPYTYRDDIESANEDIARYEDRLRDVATNTGVVFVPLHATFSASTPLTMLNVDGVHPNDQGHEFIAEVLWTHIANWFA